MVELHHPRRVHRVRRAEPREQCRRDRIRSRRHPLDDRAEPEIAGQQRDDQRRQSAILEVVAELPERVRSDARVPATHRRLASLTPRPRRRTRASRNCCSRSECTGKHEAHERAARDQRRDPGVDLLERERRRARTLPAPRRARRERRPARARRRAPARCDTASSRSVARLAAAAHGDDASQPAVVQDADAIGEPRELVEVVRRDQDDAVRRDAAHSRRRGSAASTRDRARASARRAPPPAPRRAAPARGRAAAGSPSRAA